jgi:CheY-like chemotaxis protein
MKSILLIDDDKFVTTLYAAKLQSEGFVVDTAHSGNEAIEKLERNRPDIIILDLNMPGISGVELLRAIRAVPLFQHVPVIIFSSAYIRTLVDEAAQLGVNKILAKSQCPPKMLISEVKKILDRAPATEAFLTTDAIALTENPTTDDIPALLEKFASSEEAAMLHNLLLRIYKASLLHISKALKENENTVPGQLGRALEKLIEDLYANPGHITASTKQTLVAGLQKLSQIYTEKPKTTLESELALKDVLRSLEE